MYRIQAAVVLLASLLLSGPLAASTTDEQAIRKVITDAYIEGLFANRDVEAVRAGFHQDFVLHVVNEGQVIQAPLEMWLDRLGLDGTPGETTVEGEFVSIDVTGNAATVKLEVREDGVHIYTDYFGLYKVDGDWKVVNKLFHSH